MPEVKLGSNRKNIFWKSPIGGFNPVSARSVYDLRNSQPCRGRCLHGQHSWRCGISPLFRCNDAITTVIIRAKKLRLFMLNNSSFLSESQLWVTLPPGGGGQEFLSWTNYLLQPGSAARWKCQILSHWKVTSTLDAIPTPTRHGGRRRVGFQSQTPGSFNKVLL